MRKTHIAHRVAIGGGQNTIGTNSGLVTYSDGFLFLSLESLIGYPSSQLLSTKTEADCNESCHRGLFGTEADISPRILGGASGERVWSDCLAQSSR